MPNAPTLEQLRDGLRITRQELAKEIGVTPGMVCHWENGRRGANGDRVQDIQAAINNILIARGSARRVNYDEVDAALLASAGVVRSPRVDVQGDLGAIDHRTTAPTAQGA